MTFFVRSVVLAVIISVAGLSSAVMICVTGCTDGAALKLAEQVPSSCHERSDSDGPMLGNSARDCTHEPPSVVSDVLTSDLRPLPIAAPPVATVAFSVETTLHEQVTSFAVSLIPITPRSSTILRI